MHSSDDRRWQRRPVSWGGVPVRRSPDVNARADLSRLVAGGLATLLAITLSGCSSTSMVNVRQDPGATVQIWIRQIPGSPTAKTAQRLVSRFTARTGVKA